MFFGLFKKKEESQAEKDLVSLKIRLDTQRAEYSQLLRWLLESHKERELQALQLIKKEEKHERATKYIATLKKDSADFEKELAEQISRLQHDLQVQKNEISRLKQLHLGAMQTLWAATFGDHSEQPYAGDLLAGGTPGTIAKEVRSLKTIDKVLAKFLKELKEAK
jgi:hypothetical protein